MRTLHQRRLWGWLASAVIVIACTGPDPAATAGTGPTTTADATPPVPAPNRTTNGDGGRRDATLLDRISDGVLPRDAAIQAFVSLFGPLPGITIDALPESQVGLEAGAAIRWLSAYRSTLTDEQWAAAQRLIDPQGSGRTELPAPWPTGGSETVSIAWRASAADPAHAAIVETARSDIGRAAGVAVTMPIVVVTNAKDSGGDNTLGYAYPSPDGNECNVHVNPRATVDAAVLRGVAVHEVWHCVQFWWLAKHRVQRTLADWIIEGQATYVAYRVAGDPTAADWWSEFLSRPDRSLFDRSYDAVGWYLLVNRETGKLSARLFDMLLAPDDESAYRIAMQGSTRVLDTWASTSSGLTPFGDDWSMVPFGAQPVTAGVEDVPLGPGTSAQLSTYDHAASLHGLRIEADVLHVESNGRARLHSIGHQPSVDDVNLGAAYYCADEERSTKCRCPDDGPDDDEIKGIGRDAILAISSGSTRSITNVRGLSIEDFCKERHGDKTTLAPCDLLTLADVQTVGAAGGIESQRAAGSPSGEASCEIAFTPAPASGDRPLVTNISIAIGPNAPELMKLRDPPAPIPELGKKATWVPEGDPVLTDANSSIGSVYAMFPCGRSFCRMIYTEWSLTALDEPALRAHAVTLAKIVQARATR